MCHTEGLGIALLGDLLFRKVLFRLLVVPFSFDHVKFQKRWTTHEHSPGQANCFPALRRSLDCRHLSLAHLICIDRPPRARLAGVVNHDPYPAGLAARLYHYYEIALPARSLDRLLFRPADFPERPFHRTYRANGPDSHHGSERYAGAWTDRPA